MALDRLGNWFPEYGPWCRSYPDHPFGRKENTMNCSHCISPTNHGDVTTIAPCKECAALVCADHRELHFNLIHLTLDDAKKQAVSLAWNDLMGLDDPDFPGYPFAAVQYRKSLPEHMQADVEEALVYVYHHEDTPPDMVAETVTL